MKLQKPFYRIGQLLVFVSILLFSLGISTFFFKETTGTLTKNGLKSVLLKGGYVGIPYVPTPSSISIVDYDLRYSYTVDGKQFEEERIGMGVNALTLSPFRKMEWEESIKRGEPIKVFYFPLAPNISVLHVGIDLLISFTLFFLGLALIKFSRWVHRH